VHIVQKGVLVSDPNPQLVSRKSLLCKRLHDATFQKISLDIPYEFCCKQFDFVIEVSTATGEVYANSSLLKFGLTHYVVMCSAVSMVMSLQVL
jgi:hypothetical protein